MKSTPETLYLPMENGTVNVARAYEPRQRHTVHRLLPSHIEEQEKRHIALDELSAWEYERPFQGTRTPLKGRQRRLGLIKAKASVSRRWPQTIAPQRGMGGREISLSCINSDDTCVRMVFFPGKSLLF